ncbi:hypothetical protein FD724_07605 [Nostoc sp. C057]|uniref:hypothetical protein n=1 Tax=Nostoc sp. C057 TaxID=2576903 RepID=UPI0015C35B5E|nr:hypothetical protein [Nostoc sp. C057]QLE47892.1 hypothetical protein FD724_07035 [Nostoc sp. C057]QLE48001.1 hypothetical protein FD724_07605 [Nostoc sp. C057]
MNAAVSRSWSDIYKTEWAFKSLDDVLPKAIAELPRKTLVQEFYGGADSTLRRDLLCLVPMEVRPRGFNFIPQDESFKRSSIEVLFEFRKLVKKYQYDTAVRLIHQTMEEIYELQNCTTSR